MIAYLKGIIKIIQPTFIILVTDSGVGYKVYFMDKFNLKLDDRIELFIYNHIREENNDLYGFTKYDELLLFEKLITVNGVGPKAGLSIMNSTNPEKIIEAIINENVVFFQSVPGIGKKVAAKIILDLKSKLSGLQSESVIGQMNDSVDLIEALSTLGYKSHEISKTISNIPSEIKNIEERVRWCLKHMVK